MGSHDQHVPKRFERGSERVNPLGMHAIVIGHEDSGHENH
jgi:hypothetical protein